MKKKGRKEGAHLIESHHLANHLAAIEEGNTHAVVDLRESELKGQCFVQQISHRAIEGATYVANLEAVFTLSVIWSVNKWGFAMKR